MLIALFLICSSLIAYHHVGYPALLRALSTRARWRPASGRVEDGAPNYFPTVTIVVPSYNEAAVIASKVENLLGLDYPANKVCIVIALDGCTDDTKVAASSAIDRMGLNREIGLVEYTSNIGKVAVLNDLISRANSEVLALTDCSATVSADALTRGVRHFSDPQVGVVCGSYSVEQVGSEEEKRYWAYQIQMKRDEAAIAAPMGAHGAFYLFRRSLWSPLPPDTINDDFVLPMSIVLRGYRAVYDDSIVAAELERTRKGQDFRRRVRIGAGNVQQALRCCGLAHPKRGMLSLLFISGKGLRAFVPLLLGLAVLISFSLALSGSAVFQSVVAGELALVFVALVAAHSRWPGIVRLKPLSYILGGYLASAIGGGLLMLGLAGRVWYSSSAGKLGRV